MKFRAFSLKLNSESNSEDMIFIFIVCEKKNRFFYEFSAKSPAQKVCNVHAAHLPEITMRSLTSRNRTADITQYSDVTLFLHTTSGGL